MNFAIYALVYIYVIQIFFFKILLEKLLKIHHRSRWVLTLSKYSVDTGRSNYTKKSQTDYTSVAENNSSHLHYANNVGTCYVFYVKHFWIQHVPLARAGFCAMQFLSKRMCTRRNIDFIHSYIGTREYVYTSYRVPVARNRRRTNNRPPRLLSKKQIQAWLSHPDGVFNVLNVRDFGHLVFNTWSWWKNGAWCTINRMFME